MNKYEEEARKYLEKLESSGLIGSFKLFTNYRSITTTTHAYDLRIRVEARGLKSERLILSDQLDDALFNRIPSIIEDMARQLYTKAVKKSLKE